MSGRRGRRRSSEEKVFGTLRWASIAFFLFIAVFPVVVMIGLSFRPAASLLREPARVLPRAEEFSLDAYARVLTPRSSGGFGFGQFIGNSVMISISTVAGALIVGVLAAYAATRLRYRGSKLINVGILLVYLFPPLVFAVPLFVVFTRMGLRPSFLAVIVIYLAFTLPLALYMLRNYFSAIPLEIEEAARIDGATRPQVIRHVVAPLSMPAIVTVGFYVFMAAWDEFLFALLFLVENRDYWTAALGINQLENNVGTPTTVLLAGCVVITVPLVIVFGVVQRYLTEGMTAGAVKD